MPETVAMIKILELVLCGVMLTLRPVTSAKVVDDIVNVSVFVVLKTCKIRNAPRKSLTYAAVRTLPVVCAAGKFVGVAISTPVY